MTVGVSGEEETKNVKKHKEKEEMTKIVLRRLPPGISPAELHAQFAPLPAGEPHAFWFCAAPGSARATGGDASDSQAKQKGDDNNGSDAAATTAAATVAVEDDTDEVAATLRRARCAFARAYLVFREEKNALSFAERFNGYVFVDKNGIESMAIVELAPNQTVPKHSMEMAKQCDERVNTLTNDVSFLKFMRRREAALAADAEGGVGARRVTDFDELVRQLEEKRRRLEEGQVQETPLTEFIRRMALEKSRKPRRRSALAANELAAVATVGTTELPTSAKQQKNKKLAMDGDEGTAPAQKEGSTRTKTRRERRRRKEQKENAPDGDKKRVARDGKTTPAAADAAETAVIRIKTRKTRRRGSGAGASVDGTPIDAHQQQQSTAKRRGTAAAAGGGDNDKKLSEASVAVAPKSGEVTIIKNTKRSNKDRPEREIYRPGQRKTAPTKAHKAQATVAEEQQKGGGHR